VEKLLPDRHALRALAQDANVLGILETLREQLGGNTPQGDTLRSQRVECGLQVAMQWSVPPEEMGGVVRDVVRGRPAVRDAA
jgi:hypothetical protein